MLAEVRELEFDKLGGGARNEHLTAVAHSGDAGGPVDVTADVALLG